MCCGRSGECPPALSPVERTLSTPHPSGTLLAAGESFKLPPVLLLSGAKGTCLLSTSGRSSASQSPPALSGVQPPNHQSPLQWELVFPEQSSRSRCAEFLGAYPLSTPFSSLLLVGWDRGRSGVLIDQGSATLPFSGSSSLLHEVQAASSDGFRSFQVHLHSLWSLPLVCAGQGEFPP